MLSNSKNLKLERWNFLKFLKSSSWYHGLVSVFPSLGTIHILIFTWRLGLAGRVCFLLNQKCYYILITILNVHRQACSFRSSICQSQQKKLQSGKVGIIWSGAINKYSWDRRYGGDVFIVELEFSFFSGEFCNLMLRLGNEQKCAWHWNDKADTQM